VLTSTTAIVMLYRLFQIFQHNQQAALFQANALEKAGKHMVAYISKQFDVDRRPISRM
jgi:hypothetical protein